MTIVSLQCLAIFLNKYKMYGRIGDFGGTDKIGAQIIEKMLSLRNVSVIQAEPAPGDEISPIPIGVNVFVNGIPKKTAPEYFVLDYDNGIDLLKPIKGKKFDGGICMDLLEHVSQPFIVAENISNSLNKGALLFVTVPWVWEIHDYHGDYWRFTTQGLETLFPKMKKIVIEVVRDQAPEEELPRTRIVAVFKKK